VSLKPSREAIHFFRLRPFSSGISIAMAICILAFCAFAVVPARAQETPKLKIEEDCRSFAISPDNRLVYAVPHVKHLKKILIERDDVWIAALGGAKKRIIDGEKFMPAPPPISYSVDSMAWSPDGKKIAASIAEVPGTSDLDLPAGGIKAILLLDDGGNEIKVAGSEKRFIENGTHAAWLADGQTVVYLSLAPPYQIFRIEPASGKSKQLYEGHTFDAVVWDAAHNRAFAVTSNLSLSHRLAIVELDLLHEAVREVSRIDSYQGALAVSRSGAKIGYFVDGDTLEVRDLANPLKPLRVKAGIGKFGWSKDERRVLLKRGPEDKSGSLVWVGIYDGSFNSMLHDLEFHDFQIAPDGESVAVTMVGKQNLLVFPLQ
jgi:hypothetical protein